MARRRALPAVVLAKAGPFAAVESYPTLLTANRPMHPYLPSPRKIACAFRSPSEHPGVAQSRLPAAAPARLWSLDVLRGLCAGVVFLSHWHLWSDFPPRNFLEKGFHLAAASVHETVSLLTWPTGGHHPAVLGFFVLSGFCIHYPFARRFLAGESPPDWRNYLRRRFLRIMPVYWAACALGLIFVIAQILRPAPSTLLVLHAGGTWVDTLIRFSGLAGIYPREIFAGNYILTTVTVEIFMYAAYPLLYRPMLDGRWRLVGAWFLGLHALAIALLAWFSPYWVFNSVFMLGVFWYGGALAAQFALTHRLRIAGRWLLLAWLFFLLTKAVPHFPGLNLIKQAAWALVCTIGILWCLRWETHPGLATRRPVRALRRVGDLSYSLYAMHTPAIMLASWVLLHLRFSSHALQLAVTMTASLAATLLVHHGIEYRYYHRRPAPDAAPAP
jgi:peptidoglycan/LPS O-acetylase OafA/YrhL